MYLVHLISIDLQLSCLFNSYTAKAYSYKPGLHYLLSNQLNLLPYLRSYYFYYLCKCLKLL